METVELFGETLRYDESRSDHSRLIWRGPTVGLAVYRSPDDASTMWLFEVEGTGLSYTTYVHRSVAEAAQHLATILMAEIEDRAQVARRLLAGIDAELKGVGR